MLEKNIETNLIKEAQSGNPDSLKALVQNYLPLVYSISFRYLQNNTDAEDATQETFVKVWKHLDRFELDKSLQAWITQIAKNTCLDILKKKKVIPFSSFETENGENYLEQTFASTDVSPHALAEQSSDYSLLDQAIKKLKPAYQKVLSLYYFKGLNFREISESLNEPLHTVKSRHRRALVSLKQLFQEM